jgi:hypothetical protein
MATRLAAEPSYAFVDWAYRGEEIIPRERDVTAPFHSSRCVSPV